MSKSSKAMGKSMADGVFDSTARGRKAAAGQDKRRFTVVIELNARGSTKFTDIDKRLKGIPYRITKLGAPRFQPKAKSRMGPILN